MAGDKYQGRTCDTDIPTRCTVFDRNFLSAQRRLEVGQGEILTATCSWLGLAPLPHTCLERWSCPYGHRCIGLNVPIQAAGVITTGRWLAPALCLINEMFANFQNISSKNTPGACVHHPVAKAGSRAHRQTKRHTAPSRRCRPSP